MGARGVVSKSDAVALSFFTMRMIQLIVNCFNCLCNKAGKIGNCLIGLALFSVFIFAQVSIAYQLLEVRHDRNLRDQMGVACA
jgi:hypothetical protein